MSLPAPIAFAAALIGGALGGILFAFLALPAAGVILAAFRTYGRYYEVVEDDHTVAPALAPEKTAAGRGSRPRWLGRRKHNPPETTASPPPGTTDGSPPDTTASPSPRTTNGPPPGTPDGPRPGDE
jgi:hypothetical protein